MSKNLKIKSIKKLSVKHDRYDLTINSTHNFYANGILIHNTSQRIGRVLANKELSYWEEWLKWFGFDINETKMDVLNGTRRVVIKTDSGNPFHGPELREQAAMKLEPFVEEHMVVYFEVVGYEPSGASIMPKHSLEKLKDKELVKQYGKEIAYSYGCPEGEHDIYVYRIAYVLPNGKTLDLSWDEVVDKCRSWGVKHVPELARINFDGDIDSLVKQIDELSDGPDPIDPRHIREGVCVRINKSGWVCFKNKSFVFKVLEGIVKDVEDYFDLEEES